VSLAVIVSLLLTASANGLTDSRLFGLGTLQTGAASEEHGIPVPAGQDSDKVVTDTSSVTGSQPGPIDPVDPNPSGGRATATETPASEKTPVSEPGPRNTPTLEAEPTKEVDPTKEPEPTKDTDPPTA